MKNRQLDEYHDWTFGAGKHNYISESEAVAQRVKCRLLSFKNDWFLNLDFGLPWLEDMVGTKDSYRVALRIKNQVLETKGVREILQCEPSFDPISRQLTMRIRYIDIYNKEMILSV